MSASSHLLIADGHDIIIPSLPDFAFSTPITGTIGVLLTNIMLYIGPPSVVTATWIYQGKRLEKSACRNSHFCSMAIAAFPDPVFLPTPRSFVERIYDVVHYTDMHKGGRFAALEEPELLLADLRGIYKYFRASQIPNGLHSKVLVKINNARSFMIVSH